jgi:hypothetical protein
MRVIPVQFRFECRPVGKTDRSDAFSFYATVRVRTGDSIAVDCERQRQMRSFQSIGLRRQP